MTGLTLKEVPSEVAELIVVISLTLDSNDLNSLPTDLSRLILLQELSVACNKFQSFPEVLFELTALTRIDMSYNDLTSIACTTFRPLKSLRELHLANNSLVLLPDELAELSSLEEIHLEGNLLKALPDLGALKRLTVLVAYDNKLQVAPRGLPASLEVVDLSRNDILELTGSNICSINALRTLDLSSNRLTELPRFRSPHLEELAVADNRLESLSSLEDLPELRVLDASRNQLRSLPFSIGALQQLTEVHLRNNSLESLPASMGMCQQLRMLDVSDNKLETLPEEMGQIMSLTHLKFRHNSLNWVPVKLADLPHLQELDLFNNRKISNLPAELTREETPAKAVLRYLSSLVGPEAVQPSLNQNATPSSSYRTPRVSRLSSDGEQNIDQVAMGKLDEEETKVLATELDHHQVIPVDEASWSIPTWLIPAVAGAGAMFFVSWMVSRRKR